MTYEEMKERERERVRKIICEQLEQMTVSQVVEWVVDEVMYSDDLSKIIQKQRKSIEQYKRKVKKLKEQVEGK